MFFRIIAMALSGGLLFGAANASLNSFGLGPDRDLKNIGTTLAVRGGPSLRTGSGSNGTTRRLGVK